MRLAQVTAATVTSMSVISPLIGSEPVPPCTGFVFADIDCSHAADPWIEQLGRDDVAEGCGGGNYCPHNPVTRGQLAVYLERTMRGTTAWQPSRGVYKTTVLVSPVPEDALASGQALLDAVNSIQAYRTSPVLIKLEPGFYDLGESHLQMKSFVDIEGSGRDNTEIVGIGAVYERFPTVAGATDCEIRDVRIRNTGGNLVAVAAAAATIRNAWLIAEGGSARTIAALDATLDDVWLDAVGPAYALGAYGQGRRLRVHVTGAQETTGILTHGAVSDSDIWVTGNDAIGIRTLSSQPITDVNIVMQNTTGVSFALDASSSYYAAQRLERINIELKSPTGTIMGLRSKNSLIDASDIRVFGQNGEVVYGLWFDSDARALVSHANIDVSSAVSGRASYSQSVNTRVDILASRLVAAAPIESAYQSATRVSGSQLVGGAVIGNTICAGVSDENFDFFPDSCP